MRARPRLLRPLGLAVLLALLAGLLWWSLLRERETIETVLVNRGDLESSISAMGTLQARNYVDVGAQASGEIRRINVAAGSKVVQGQLIAEIDPAAQQAKLDTDRANLENLRAQLLEQVANGDLAQQQLERQQRMQAEGSTREEDVQIAQNALRVAHARIASLRAQLAGAASTVQGSLVQLGYTRIFAPMNGTVVTLDARVGQTLNATYQTPRIMRIADLTTMTVWTQVSEADIRHVREGMPAWFSTLGDDRRWRGQVRQILPAPALAAGGELQDAGKAGATASKVVFYTVLLDVDNPDGTLRPQMSAQVHFIAQTVQGALLAPLAALQAIPGSSAQYRAQVLQADGRIAERQLRTGLNDRLQVEVLAGLAEGERLVTRRETYRPINGRVSW
ncbi:family efflux transporter membrane-fusion protein [Herbaspirillum rubrisubalbicans M1]|uniref:efflux RND transporter periplasmic adaptor subunit n=1 Tax=Herbaspirillum rubrisubalbicans TaxID=80842 RepID=UPI00073A0643|nr:efflux RND transporter periplasmic adaptor subunit [Herbaspirillum rubrisubalbicans]ALU89455.1 family efflux transporter membrane-fusion protein [Herbaspirillum rubrisubalbicans M1]